MTIRFLIKVLRGVFLHYCLSLLYEDRKVIRGREIRNCNQQVEIEIVHFHSLTKSCSDSSSIWA